MLLFLGDDAAAGVPIKATSRIRAILARIESFWERVKQLSGSRWVERVSSGANPADAPSRNRPACREPGAKEELASLQMALMLRRVSGGELNLNAKFLWEQQRE